VKTVTIGTITYQVVPVRGDVWEEVPRELGDLARWYVVACPARTPESIAGWITADPGGWSCFTGEYRSGSGGWSCFTGGDDYRPGGPRLAYLRNVRWPRRTGLPVIARAYASWLTGHDQQGGSRHLPAASD
jgi:hypothetical protein